jgi:hypothetical protein
MDVDFLTDEIANVTLSQTYMYEHIETKQHIFEGLQTTVGLVSKYFLSYTTGAVGWVLGV